uniref:Death domain-containing protein n=1 Tax=Denticeps clupeoides TaxID=299321 RepID=A0AAY4APH0_9TELE
MTSYCSMFRSFSWMFFIMAWGQFCCPLSMTVVMDVQTDGEGMQVCQVLLWRCMIYIRSPHLIMAASAVQEAPLQMLLNNLDVLEELFILLDPDSKGVKSTRHLATRCDFSSTWINYIYSMKDSKSPLVAVLEAVATRSPEWTVGHLAKQLREMNRNDAVAVLGKLSVSREAEAGNSGQKAGC